MELADLNGAIGKLEDATRACEYRKEASRAQPTLTEDIRTASLEALPLGDMEQHVQMKGFGLTTYLLLREETVRCCEARCMVHEKLGSLSAHRRGGYDPWTLAASEKGNTGGNVSKFGDGDKKSEKERTAECGKQGHNSRDCWWPRKEGK